jgi:hypothetical protein
LIVVLALGVSLVLFPARAYACGPPLTGVNFFVDFLVLPLAVLLSPFALIGFLIFFFRRIDRAFVPGFTLVGAAFVLLLWTTPWAPDSDNWILYECTIALGGTGLLLIQREWSRKRSNGESVFIRVRPVERRSDDHVRQLLASIHR